MNKRRVVLVLLLLVPAAVVGVVLLRTTTADAQPPVPDREGKPGGGQKVVKAETEWRAQLTPEQFRVARRHGTERAFTGEYWDTKSDGVYACVCCGQPLFDAAAKYESGTGWPSF